MYEKFYFYRGNFNKLWSWKITLGCWASKHNLSLFPPYSSPLTLVCQGPLILCRWSNPQMNNLIFLFYWEKPITLIKWTFIRSSLSAVNCCCCVGLILSEYLLQHYHLTTTLPSEDLGHPSEMSEIGTLSQELPQIALLKLSQYVDSQSDNSMEES